MEVISMQLSDEIIDAFVKTLPNGEKDNSNGYELYYGTVKVSNGKTSVILDGSPVETPLNYLTMGAENGAYSNVFKSFSIQRWVTSGNPSSYNISFTLSVRS